MFTPICSSGSPSPPLLTSYFSSDFRRSYECDAAARNDAFFNRSARGVHGILDASFLLFHLGFGCRTDFDHGHTADEFRETLLQFLAIVVGSGVFDLGPKRFHAAFDVMTACRRLRRSWCCLCRS